MFIDDIKYRYTYLNTLKNAVWQEGIDKTPDLDRPIIIHAEVEPLLNRLSKERPTWRFKSDETFFTSPFIRSARNFTIYDGDEALGRLWLEFAYSDGTPRFYFDNFRLEKKRQKSAANYSTKPDVAVKRILKAFHLKTPKERATEAFSEVRKLMQTVHSDAHWPLRRVKNIIEGSIFNYVVKHWDTIKHELEGDAGKYDLPTMIQNNNDAEELIEAATDGGGVAIRVEANNTYLVCRPESGSFLTAVHTDDTLSDHLRTGMGLLKLMEDGTHIAGVGIRINRNLYFVMDKSGDD